MLTKGRSIEGLHSHTLESFSKFVDTHVLARYHELAYIRDVDWLLSFFFELEADFVFLPPSDLFLGRCCGSLFKSWQFDGFFVTEKSHREAAANKGDTFALLLEFLRVRRQPGDVEGWIWAIRPHKELLLLRVSEHSLDLETEDLLVLLSNLVGQSLVSFEELFRCLFKLAQIDIVSLTEVSKDTSLVAENFNSSLLSHVGQTDDTVRFPLGSEDSDPTNLCGVVGVSTAACFDVDTVDIYNTKGVTWHDTTLIQTESMQLLCLRLIHESF